MESVEYVAVVGYETLAATPVRTAAKPRGTERKLRQFSLQCSLDQDANFHVAWCLALPGPLIRRMLLPSTHGSQDSTVRSYEHTVTGTSY